MILALFAGAKLINSRIKLAVNAKDKRSLSFILIIKGRFAMNVIALMIIGAMLLMAGSRSPRPNAIVIGFIAILASGYR
jgi:hypothetical protein